MRRAPYSPAEVPDKTDRDDKGVLGLRKKVALIGLGDIARKVYLPLLSGHPEAEVCGVLSASDHTVQQTVQEYRFPRGTTNLDELLGWELDAVFVHSPTPTHESIVTRCLERGVAVYVDKPLSYDYAASQRMAELAEKRKVLLAVGFNRRFAPMYMEVQKWLDAAGGAGFASAVKHRTKQQTLSARETVHDDLIHMLDLLLWLGGGDYDRLRGSLLNTSGGRLLRAQGTVSMTGIEGMFAMVRDAGADMEKLELHGSGRSAEVADMENAVLYERDAAPRSLRFGSWDTVQRRRGFEGALNHFLACIGRPEDCTVSAGRVLSAHRLADELGGKDFLHG